MPRLECSMQFGFTEIIAHVKNLSTGEVKRILLNFDVDASPVVRPKVLG